MSERIAHLVHVVYRPAAEDYAVVCDQGCYLGHSAVQPTLSAAYFRAEVHLSISNWIGLGIESRPAPAARPGVSDV